MVRKKIMGYENYIVWHEQKLNNLKIRIIGSLFLYCGPLKFLPWLIQMQIYKYNMLISFVKYRRHGLPYLSKPMPPAVVFLLVIVLSWCSRGWSGIRNHCNANKQTYCHKTWCNIIILPWIPHLLTAIQIKDLKRNLVLVGKIVNRQWQMSFHASWLVVFWGTDVCHWMFKTKLTWFKARVFPLYAQLRYIVAVGQSYV